MIIEIILGVGIDTPYFGRDISPIFDNDTPPLLLGQHPL